MIRLSSLRHPERIRRTDRDAAPAVRRAEDLFQRPGFQPGEMYLGVIADDTDQVRESNEANNIASTELRVEERPPIPPPVADFTASPTSGPAPLTVQFTNLSKGEITSYYWDFGDGATSTERDPVHTYLI